MKEGEMHFYPSEWKNISKDCRFFITGLADPDWEKRFNLLKAFNHPWIMSLFYENVGIHSKIEWNILDVPKSSLIQYNQVNKIATFKKKKIVPVNIKHKRSKTIGEQNELAELSKHLDISEEALMEIEDEQLKVTDQK